MASLYSFLKDPETVAKFQRLCGIVRTADPPALTFAVWSDAAKGPGHSDPGQKLPAAESESLTNGVVTSRRPVKETNGRGHVPSKCETGERNKPEKANPEYMINNRLLFYIFHFGANLGNEIFYMTFLPFWFWNIDGCVGRQLSTFWCIFMYIGQALKDVFRIPRPAAPPVVQLEKRYALEYGMPSTHAMVGAGIPFAIFFLTKERYIYPYELALAGAVVWSSLVSISRIYLGMHSILDVLAGLALISGLMALLLPYLGALDYFLLHSHFAPLVCIAVPLALVVFYPTPHCWNTTRRDTTYILAAGSGISLGHWLSYQSGFMMQATSPPPYDIIPPTWTWAALVVIRMALGIGVLLVVRAVVAAVTYRFACRLAGLDPRDTVAARQHTIVDLSHKYITYTTIAAGMVFAAPMLFRALGIERETYFTEI